MARAATMAELAEAKRLPVEELKQFGLRDMPRGGVEIPYYDEAGQVLARKRRLAIRAKEGSFWPAGTGLQAYGQWRLNEARQARMLILVEGESDCWALWHHRLPALGLPGANTAGTLQAAHLAGLEVLYVHREHDGGGEAFVEGVRRRLGELGFAGKAWEMSLPCGVKDFADLHREHGPGFLNLFEQAVLSSTPMELGHSTLRIADRREPAEVEPWDSLPRDPSPPMPFPLDVLPEPVRQMAQTLAAALPCPVDMPATAGLAALACAIGATRQVCIKEGWHEGARLWLAIVAPPGSKKSPAARTMLRPLFLRQKKFDQEHEQALLRHEAETIAWEQAAALAKKGGTTPPAKPRPPVARQLLTIDSTREALMDLLVENPRGLMLYRDELTGWVRALNQYKGGRGDDKQLALSMWSGEPVYVHRKGRRQSCHEPFLGVLGCLPPEVLGELHDERGREDGFIHRILFSWPEHARGGWREAEPDRFIVGEYTHLIGKLLELDFANDETGIRPVLLQMAPEAREYFATFCNTLADRLDDDAFPESLHGPAAKMEGYCARLALVLHLSRQAAAETNCAEVEGASVYGAVKLCEYFLAHAERVYPHLECRDLSRLERDADAVVGWILRHRDVIEEDRPDKPAGTFTSRMLQHDLKRFEGRSAELEKVLEFLVSREILREEERPRQGVRGRHPRPFFRVHPEIGRLNRLNRLKSGPA